MEIDDLRLKIRDIPDFPSKGIIFRDLTTLLKDGEALHVMSKALVDLYRDKGVTKIVGIESRGFIGGSTKMMLWCFMMTCSRRAVRCVLATTS